MKSCYSLVVTNSVQKNRIKFQAPCLREKGLPNWPCLFLIVWVLFVFLPWSVLLSSTSFFPTTRICVNSYFSNCFLHILLEIPHFQILNLVLAHVAHSLFQVCGQILLSRFCLLNRIRF